MRRRDFIIGITGSAVALPLAAHAQQPQMPVIGFLGTSSPDLYAIRLGVFRDGLKEAGYVEGQYFIGGCPAVCTGPSLTIT